MPLICGGWQDDEYKWVRARERGKDPEAAPLRVVWVKTMPQCRQSVTVLPLGVCGVWGFYCFTDQSSQSYILRKRLAADRAVMRRHSLFGWPEALD